jgi:hypothetical protein
MDGRITKILGTKFQKPLKSTFEVHRNDSVIELMESKTLTKNQSIPQLAPLKTLADDETSQMGKTSKTPQRKRVENQNQMASMRNELNDIEKKINSYQNNVTKISDAYNEAQNN